MAIAGAKIVHRSSTGHTGGVAILKTEPDTFGAVLPQTAEAATATIPDVSVVLPCLNEAGAVSQCVREALDSMAQAGIDGEVVVVDNGSTDGSPELAQSAGARVIRETRRGYGRAVLSGIEAAH